MKQSADQKPRKQSGRFMPLMTKYLEQDFGADRARRYQEEALALQAQYLRQLDDRGSAAVRDHITQNILPVVSLFRALGKDGMPAEDAREYVSNRMHKIAELSAKSMRSMSRVPFFFALFRRICPSFMKKNYPAEGWDMRWKRCDREEIAFDCHRCVYLEVTTQLGCPELCVAFCENDDIAYGAMAPNVLFMRTKTLAGGSDCCDFRLLNGKYH